MLGRPPSPERQLSRLSEYSRSMRRGVQQPIGAHFTGPVVRDLCMLWSDALQKRLTFLFAVANRTRASSQRVAHEFAIPWTSQHHARVGGKLLAGTRAPVAQSTGSGCKSPGLFARVMRHKQSCADLCPERNATDRPRSCRLLGSVYPTPIPSEQRKRFVRSLRLSAEHPWRQCFHQGDEDSACLEWQPRPPPAPTARPVSAGWVSNLFEMQSPRSAEPARDCGGSARPGTEDVAHAARRRPIDL
jgi:hypothetical protein